MGSRSWCSAVAAAVAVHGANAAAVFAAFATFGAIVGLGRGGGGTFCPSRETNTPLGLAAARGNRVLGLGFGAGLLVRVEGF